MCPGETKGLGCQHRSPPWKLAQSLISQAQDKVTGCLLELRPEVIDLVSLLQMARKDRRGLKAGVTL